MRHTALLAPIFASMVLACAQGGANTNNTSGGGDAPDAGPAATNGGNKSGTGGKLQTNPNSPDAATSGTPLSTSGHDAGKAPKTATKDAGGTGAPAPGCSATSSQNDCLSCCANEHPAAAAVHNDAFAACVCNQPGTCAGVCANETCAGLDPLAGDPCDQCLASADCTQEIDSACNADSECSALVACIDTAGCGTK